MSFACRILLPIAALALAGLAALAEPASDPVLARWKGGELRLSKWRQEYAQPGQTLDPARPDIWGKAVAKAAYREIYRDYARRSRLESSSPLLAKVEKWRRARLSRIYLDFKAPDFTSRLTEDDLRRFHQERSRDLFFTEGRADVVVLYLRCSLRPADRRPCLERMAAYGERLRQGTPLAELAAEEKARSGSANGEIADIGIKDLNSDLRSAVAGLEAGQLSAVVEAPHGLFLAEVKKRWNRGTIPWEQERGVIRDVYLREKSEAWELEEVKRLGGVPGTREATLAAAAVALGLDRADTYLRQEAAFRDWTLADLGFAHDKEAHPSDEILQARLESRKSRFEKLRLYVFTLPVEGDRGAVFARAGQLSEQLAKEGETAALLMAKTADGLLAGGRSATFEVRRDQLAKRSPALEKAVAEISAGKTVGPVPLEGDDFDLAADEPRFAVHSRADYRFLAFVGVLDRRLPPIDEVRLELLEEDTAAWSRGPAVFIPYFQKRWNIELFPETPFVP